MNCHRHTQQTTVSKSVKALLEAYPVSVVQDFRRGLPHARTAGPRAPRASGPLAPLALAPSPPDTVIRRIDKPCSFISIIDITFKCCGDYFTDLVSHSAV